MMGMIICESMLHEVGVLQGVVGVDPVCVEGVLARADWDKSNLF